MKMFSTLGLILTLTLACNSAKKEGGSESEKTLVIGLSDRPTTLDPRYATDANSKRIDDLLYSALVQFDDHLQLQPLAAERWVVKPRLITFLLKPNLHFASGQRVAVEDVAASIDAYRKPTSPAASSLEAIAKIEVREPNKVILHLSRDDAALLANFVDIKIMPRQFTTAPQSDSIPGSGLFQLDEFLSGSLRLNRVEEERQGQVTSLLFKFVRDENTRYLKMIKGELDVLMNELSEEKVAEIRKSPKVKVLITPGLNFNYVLVNFRVKPLDDLRVRQALFSAMNRDSLIHYKLEDLATRAGSILAPVNPFSLSDLSFIPTPLSEARKIIHEVGLDKIEVSLKTSDQALSNGQVLAHEWNKNLNLRIVHQSFEWATFYSDVKNGRYQLALMRWVGIVDPDVYRDTLSSKEFPPGRNRGFYTNQEFDVLVDQARHELSESKRRALYTKAQVIVAKDLPILPLWYNANVSVLGLRVKNFVPVVTGGFLPLTRVIKE